MADDPNLAGLAQPANEAQEPVPTAGQETDAIGIKVLPGGSIQAGTQAVDSSKSLS